MEHQNRLKINQRLSTSKISHQYCKSVESAEKTKIIFPHEPNLLLSRNLSRIKLIQKAQLINVQPSLARRHSSQLELGELQEARYHWEHVG